MAHRISIAPEKNNKTGDRTFSNAVIVSSFILLISLVAMIRTSPHETLQYFNVIKALSIRNLDEGIVNMRVTSANNIFIYLFCSALVAINIFLYAGNMSLTVQRGSTANHLLNLLLIAGVVFLILTLKIIIISVLTRLFKITAFGPGQFYNYVRLMLFGFSISAAVLLTNFMIGVEIDKMISILTYFIIGLAVLFLAITFLKLYSRGGFTVFHLFSYLCASEIIPLVILLSLFFS